REYVRIPSQVSDSLLGIGSEGLHVGVAQHVECGREIWVYFERSGPQLCGTLEILLEEQPLPREIEDMFVLWVARQEVVHGGDGGDDVCFLRAGQKLHQQAFVA